MVSIILEIHIPPSLWTALDTPLTTKHTTAVDLLVRPHKGDIIDMRGRQFGEPVNSVLKLYGDFLTVKNVIHTVKGPGLYVLADVQGGSL